MKRLNKAKWTAAQLKAWFGLIDALVRQIEIQKRYIKVLEKQVKR